MDKDLQMEQQRVNDVRSIIDRKMLKIGENVGGLKEDIINLRKNFWDDVTVNIDEPDEVIETFTSIKQQSEFLAERERSHKQFYKQLHDLKRLKNSPYFGRFDFIEEGEDVAESIYLGVSSLMDEREDDFLIYDWRAPISSLYYDYSPGPAQYKTPVGTINGTMDLKRQFIIRDGHIQSMFDTGVTIGDELLQEVLGNAANTQMKSIVATIQKEQNQIIRNERSRYLIVQGVAGSGKTSAALQRVAYLLYRYREKINADNIMLFSPNPLFNSYVATVLPELGEENMEQTTFQEYIEKRVGKNFTLEDPFTQMEYILTSINDDEYNARLAGIKYKANLHFKKYIDGYVNFLGNSGLIFKNITFRGESLVTKHEIKEYFYSLDPSISIPNRMTIVRDWLLQTIRQKERQEREKEWVINEIELLDKEEYLKAYHKVQKPYEGDAFDDFENEQKLLGKWVVKKRFRPIKKAIKQLKFINYKSLYRQLFELEMMNFKKGDLPDSWDKICAFSVQTLNQHILLYEDAAPYLYLQDQIAGRKSNTLIRHLLIDEAQDYSPFQFEYLKQLFPFSRMTILGDINQAIYAHTFNAPTLLSKESDGLEQYERIELVRSYRSTKQIVEFTKGLIKGGEVIEPFNREGKKPTLTKVEDQLSLNSCILEQIGKLQSSGYETIAIICKTAQESKEAYDEFKDKLPVRLMDKETSSFEKGILILPTYLAKGIEFDAVIIYNASNETYGREYERKHFYTACTRAMHELHLFTIGNKSMFMDDVPKETYEYIKNNG